MCSGPEHNQARNRLEQSFQEKCEQSQRPLEESGNTKSNYNTDSLGFRVNSWSCNRGMEKLRLNRCGVPCNEEPRLNQYQQQERQGQIKSGHNSTVESRRCPDHRAHSPCPSEGSSNKNYCACCPNVDCCCGRK